MPEIYDGTVEVQAPSPVRRAAARRWPSGPTDENVDPIGACVGPRGQRVAAIVDELHGEKIDIIKYSEDPAEFIAAALAPADVISVTLLRRRARAAACSCRTTSSPSPSARRGRTPVWPPRLTGYKIDIKPASVRREARSRVEACYSEKRDCGLSHAETAQNPAEAVCRLPHNDG